MKKLKLFLALPLLVFLGFGLNSCSSDVDPETPSADLEYVNENALSDTTTEFDFDFSMGILSDNNALNRSGVTTSSAVPSCATVTTVTGPNNTFPKTFTIDFGNGCTSPNGITRSGKLIVNISKPWYQSGAVMTISRENFFVNNIKVEGTIINTNETVQGSAPTWTRQIINGKITKPNGNYFQFYGMRNISQIEGVNTPTLADNIYRVNSGEHHITRSNGTMLDITILEPLIKKVSCQYISKGIVKLLGTNINGKLNYGNGDCDNLAIFTDANGVSHIITL